MGRNPLIAIENRRKRRRLSLMKATQSSYCLTVTSYHEKIEAKFHSIKISGDYKYKQLVENLGELHFDYRYFRRKNKIFNAKYNITINGFKLNIFTDPLKPGMPQVSIGITPPDGISSQEYNSFLGYINDLFPNHKLSSVENAIDVFYKDSSEVEAAYEVAKRNVFVPRKRTKPIINQNSIKIGNHKIYKRGNDNNKSKKGWERKDLNRVRYEYTSKRRELKKNGINCLSDLRRSSKYFDNNNEKWNFMYFKVTRSKQLPGVLDPYPFDGSFQGEYFAAKDKVKNRSRSLAEAWGFDCLKYDFLDAMKLFDLKWKPLPC